MARRKRGRGRKKSRGGSSKRRGTFSRIKGIVTSPWVVGVVVGTLIIVGAFWGDLWSHLKSGSDKVAGVVNKMRGKTS